MKLFGREIEGYPRLLVILSSILLVSLGLCAISPVGIGKQGGPPSVLWTIPTLAAFLGSLLSALGIVVILIIWPLITIASALYQRFAKPPKDGIQRLFDEESKRDDDHLP